ncbi:MAG: aminoacyl-tRNA hydrolase [Deltaproteobacteria bacterium]|nr:aminoacyl-tRNA hydrolase [Candidatus Tharpella sp.]
MDESFLVVGLGNPGPEYSETRHNIGFKSLDFLRKKIVPPSFFKYEDEYQAEILVGKLEGFSVCLVKPQTFMNLSGKAVRSILTDFTVVPQKIIVVHDDLDLPLGRMKLKCGGGSGGHNGIKSLIEELGSTDFLRLRIGVSGVSRSPNTIDYVLSPFAEIEKEVVLEVIERSVAGLIMTLRLGVAAAMNQVNRRGPELL